MDKTAQQRGKINKLKEKVKDKLIPNVFRASKTALEEKMEEVDDKIREEASKLKELLKAAKSSFSRREYIEVVSYLGRFHDISESIDNFLSELNSSIDTEHFKFLVEDLDKEHSDYLLDKLDPKLVEKFKNKINKKKVANERVVLEKNAGLSDWWHNLTSDRGKNLSVWEKNFPKYTKELKNSSANMIKKSEAYFVFLLGSLKKLDNLRTGRKIEDYLKESSKLRAKFDSFDESFNQFYSNNAKKYIDMKRNLQSIKDLENVERENEAQKELLNRKIKTDLELEQLKQKMEQEGSLYDSEKAPRREPFPPQRGPFQKQHSLINDPTGKVEEFDTAKTAPVPENVIPITKNLKSTGPHLPEGHEPMEEGPHIPPHAGILGPNGEVMTEEQFEQFDPKGLNQAKAASYQNFLTKISSEVDKHPLLIAKEIIIFASKCEDKLLKEKLLNIAKKMV